MKEVRRSVIACMREVIPAAVCDRGSGLVVSSSSAAKHRRVAREMRRQKRMIFLASGMVGCWQDEKVS